MFDLVPLNRLLVIFVLHFPYFKINVTDEFYLGFSIVQFVRNNRLVIAKLNRLFPLPVVPVRASILLVWVILDTVD